MVAQHLREVRERIERAAARSGRDPAHIRLLAVTKTRPRSAVDEAVAAGIRLFGENRVQEADRKYTSTDDVELHLIGHLQRNKAKLVPDLFSWVESIDAYATAQALSRRCDDAGRECSILLQLNSSGEQSKSGYADPQELLDEAARIAGLPALALRGVMTIGPFTDDTAAIARAFATTREVYEQLRRALPSAAIDTLSMGMSDDFEIAIAEGSTEIRVGSVLFGARS
ncbi:MAG: YggS family pyridoxal phosphate-dependent enzyme [Spirochaetota bacterium]